MSDDPLEKLREFLAEWTVSKLAIGKIHTYIEENFIPKSKIDDLLMEYSDAFPTNHNFIGFMIKLKKLRDE